MNLSLIKRLQLHRHCGPSDAGNCSPPKMATAENPTSYPYPIPDRLPKIAMIHVLQHGQKRPLLESGFPPSPSWEAGDCSHPPLMAHRGRGMVVIAVEYHRKCMEHFSWGVEEGKCSRILAIAHSILKGLWGMALSNLSILRKVYTLKYQWFPVVYCFCRNCVFVIWFENVHFCTKKIKFTNSKALKYAGEWLVSRHGKGVQLIRRACTPTIHRCV